MRFSRAFIPTLREVPADAELTSHRLLLRGGYMRKLASGVYSWLPMGWKVMRKIARIVSEENDRVDGQQMLLPALQPRELWEQTGRSDLDVLFHLRDRGDREMLLGMSHEEVITSVIRDDVRSYRQLPLILYQIQTKFRDEPRPRGGALRSREFQMHDCYSFHETQESLDAVYRDMSLCYARALSRMGLEFVVVEADAGPFGGGTNHEFAILVDSGEDAVMMCSSCDYAANRERCEIGGTGDEVVRLEPDTLRTVSTPGMRTVEEVTGFLQVAPEKLIKTLIYTDEQQNVYVALVRGDRELNESKLSRALEGSLVDLASPEVIERVTGAPVGFAGPHGLQDVVILADRELRGGGNWISGANRHDAHVMNLNEGRDFKVDRWEDLRVAEDGDTCPRCGGELERLHGIEAAHIFQLSDRFSARMGATVQDGAGVERPVLTGSYGFGISRAMAAIAEEWADADGLLWPISVAPFEVVIICLNAASHGEVAEGLYGELLQAGLDVLYDDREERAGVKFKDADLLGIPIQIVVGRDAEDGWLEMRLRGCAERTRVGVAEAAQAVAVRCSELYAALLEKAEAARVPVP